MKIKAQLKINQATETNTTFHSHIQMPSSVELIFSVLLDPDGDGSCQFSAATDHLRRLGIEHSGLSLRHDIVRYLRKNADIHEFRNYIEGNDIDNYLEGMSQMGTYSDHITLQAIADLFAIKVQVVLPSGVDYCILTPQFLRFGKCYVLRPYTVLFHTQQLKG